MNRIAIPILLVGLITGCSSLLPGRTITIIDEAGMPIAEARLTPYPIIPFGNGNATDSRGRIRFYKTGASNIVGKTGYKSLWIRYADTNTVYTLRKAD